MYKERPKKIEGQRIEGVVHPTAIIGPNVWIEQGAKIGPFCIIGYPAEKIGSDNNHGVLIRAGAELTGHVTVDAGTEYTTVVDNNCYLMKHVHIGHDAWLRQSIVIAPGAVIGGFVIIGGKVGIGINASIHQRVFIPDGCFIGAGCVIPRGWEGDIYRKYVGVPARDIGRNYPNR